jgi:hypothetical protein
MLSRLREFPFGYILIAITVGAIGGCFIAFQNAFQILAVSIGIILALCGILFGVAAIVKPRRGIGFAFKLGIAIICIVCGIVTAVVQDGAISLIKDIFCLLLIIDGAFKLQTAARAIYRRLYLAWGLVAISLLTIVPAFLLAKFVVGDESMTTMLLGFVMIDAALGNFFAAFFTDTAEL